MKKVFTATLAACAISTSAIAQEAPPSPAPTPQVAPLVATVAPPAPALVLPANTELRLTMNQDVTTKGDRWNEGDTFDLTLSHDVRVGDYIVIPQGSRGVGRITWLTNKGAFGKSGKMEIALEYVVVNGRNIPITGEYRQEGEGNTVATVGGVIAAGIFAGFITGKSGLIPQGRELVAHTRDDLPVVLPARAATVAAPVAIQPDPVVPAAQPAAVPAATNDGSAPVVVNF